MAVRPDDVEWTVSDQAQGLFSKIKKSVGQARYAESKAGLKQFLCDYFNTGRCINSTNSINPVGATPQGGKILKVRWLIPGGGKSGGLRLAVVAYCETQEVVIAGAWLRKEDPTDIEFGEATERYP